MLVVRVYSRYIGCLMFLMDLLRNTFLVVFCLENYIYVCTDNLTYPWKEKNILPKKNFLSSAAFEHTKMRIDFATLPATTFVYSEFLWIAIVVCLRRWLAGRLYPVCCKLLTNAAYEVTWFEVVLLSSTVYLGWQLIIRATSSNWDLSLKFLPRKWFLWWDSSLWKSIVLTKILPSIWKNPTHDFLI